MKHKTKKNNETNTQTLQNNKIIKTEQTTNKSNK